MVGLTFAFLDTFAQTALSHLGRLLYVISVLVVPRGKRGDVSTHGFLLVSAVKPGVLSGPSERPSPLVSVEGDLEGQEG